MTGGKNHDQNVIDNVPLFDLPTGGGEPVTSERGRAPRSVAFGNCPACTNQRVGLIRSAEHLMWRQHWITTWAGTSTPCRTSGVRLCDAPEAEPYVTPVAGPAHCPHQPSGAAA